MKFDILLLFLPFLLASCAQIEIDKHIDTSTSPKVVNVYPTSDTLPENLLRLYVQFSQSMKAVNNLEHIKLLNDEGEEIKGAIFNNVYELWDSDQKQLTLILDPSRVKTGLIAHETLGRALAPNKHFQLIIEKAEDIYGNIIKESFVKNIFVIKADTVIPNVDNWKIIAPKSNSLSPIRIVFPQSLDYLSLLSRIRLLNTQNEVIKGSIKISNQERIWSFFPNEIWEKGIYTLQVNSRLEDSSGNNLNGLFDHKIGNLKDQQEGKIVEITIEVK